MPTTSTSWTRSRRPTASAWERRRRVRDDLRRSGARPTRPEGSRSFGDIVDNWLELSYALNQINRSMGHDDLYPFVLAPNVIRKLAFVDHMVHRT